MAEAKTLLHRIFRDSGGFIGAGFFVAALRLVHRELRTFHYHDVFRALGSLPAGRLGLVFLLTILNYEVLAGCDFIAFRRKGRTFRGPYGLYPRLGPSRIDGLSFYRADIAGQTGGLPPV